MKKEVTTIYHYAGIALAGYDPVAYFDEGIALRGKEVHQIDWKGLTWRFTSENHLKQFRNKPEKYLPEYGGFCAFGVSNGYLAKPKLSTFEIVDGKLYLNFSEYVKKRWQENRESRIIEADSKWDGVKNTRQIVANRQLVYLKYRFFKLFGRDTLA